MRELGVVLKRHRSAPRFGQRLAQANGAQPTEVERDPLRELRFPGLDGEERRARDAQQCSRTQRPHGRRARSAVEKRDLAKHRAGMDRRDRLFAEQRRRFDDDLAFDEDEEAIARIAGFDENLVNYERFDADRTQDRLPIATRGSAKECGLSLRSPIRRDNRRRACYPAHTHG